MAEQTGNIIEGAWSNDNCKRDISYVWVTQMEDIQTIEQGIPILDFAERSLKRNPDMEFRLIRRITETQFHNEELKNYHPKLNKMNRYNNILPYKHTEVKLDPSDDEDEDLSYINASYINSVHSGTGQRKFIATQGPLPETFSNFWKMIWSNQVHCIVMLCNLKENDKVQCDQYWPTAVGQNMQYGKISVTFEEEEVLHGCLYKRKLKVSQIPQFQSESQEETVEERIIYQIHMSEWRDHGVPDKGVQTVIEELIEIMIGEYNLQRPSVVHCSAGVGRTGTLISLVNLTLNLRHHLPTIKASLEAGDSTLEKDEQQLKNCTLSIFGIVRRLREQRWGMVHHGEQYGYLYKYMQSAVQQALLQIGVENTTNGSHQQESVESDI